MTDLSDNAFLSEDLSEAAFCDLDPLYIADLKGKPQNIKELQKRNALERAEINLNERYTAEKILVRLDKLGSKGIPCYKPSDSGLEGRVD